MKQPTIGVYIPTPGRESLRRTLWSIATQKLIPGDEILVIGDGYSSLSERIVKSMGSPFEYIPIQQTRDWGHTQCNYGVQNLSTDVGIAQDDDDIFAPRAFEEIRKAVTAYPDGPIMARVKTPGFGVLWSAPVTPPFDGHCLIYPNKKDKLGVWGSTYDGDQLYIRTTLEKYDNVGWLDKVISLTRPKWKLWAFPLSWNELNHLRMIRNSGREFMTNHREEISWEQQKEWFTKLNLEENWYWVFYEETNWNPVGYVGLNRKSDDKIYATYCLLPEFRGKGWGKELVEWSCWAAQDELTIEVLESNVRAINLYKKCGFKEHWTRNGIIEMYSEWPPRF